MNCLAAILLAALQIVPDAETAGLAVSDSRTGRTWASLASGSQRFSLRGLKATKDGWQAELRRGTNAAPVRVRLQADAARPNEFTVELTGEGAFGPELAWPIPFATRPGDRLIVPRGEGFGYPVDEPHNGLRSLKAYAGHGLSMAFFGVTEDKTGAGWMAILETADDASAFAERRGGKSWVIGPQWESQKGAWGYPRRVRYVFFDRGGHVAMCRRYREYAAAAGRVVTLQEKAKRRPHVLKLPGAANFWLQDAGRTDRAAFARELVAAGFDRILWSSGGSDREVRELREIPGVLVGRYDVYQDVMDPARKGEYARVLPTLVEAAFPQDINWAGPTSNDWRRGWRERAKDGTNRLALAMICDARAVPYARARISEELAHRPYDTRFIDTVTATDWFECHHPDHPMTRTESREWKMRLLDLVSGEFGLVCGSETGHDAAVPYCDYFEGMMSPCPYRIPQGGHRQLPEDASVPPLTERYQVGERYRLPLWELVYHDCTVATWFWSDFSNGLPAVWKKRDLLNALYGTPPLYCFSPDEWRRDRDRYVRSFRRATETARRTAGARMTDHRILSADRSVQQTVFSNGVTVTVDFKKGSVRIDTKKDAASDDICARVRRDHPRMFFNAETWPEIKSRTEATSWGRDRRDRLVERARKYPANPVCSGMGPVTSPPSQPIPAVREWGSEASECALAWRFTGDPALLEKARRMLEVSAAAYLEATANGRAVGWWTTPRILAYCAYDWIYEGLSDGQRRALIVPLVNHAEEVQPGKRNPPLIRNNSGGVTSGFYGARSLLWYSGLAAFGDGFCDDLARDHLRRGHELCRKLLAFRASMSGDDGGLAHGTPGYTTGAYPWAHFNFLHTYRSACGVNLANDYRSLAYFPNWVWWSSIPRAADPTRPFEFGYGDGSHTDNLFPIGSLFEHMSQYAHFFAEADPDAARLAATLCEVAPNRSLGGTWPVYPFLLAPGGAAKPFTAEEIAARRIGARHFADIGQFVLHSGVKPDSTYCLYTAGARTYDHKHLDENNFVIYRNGFQALDSGSRARERDTSLRYYYSQTVAHNCVLVHAPNEPMPEHWGLKSSESAAKFNDGGQYPTSAKVLAFETNPDFTYIASDAAPSYGKKCRACVRQFVHVQPDVFVVYDRVDAADASYAKEWLLHTKDEPVTEGRVTRASCDGGRLFCETLLPAKSDISKVGGPGKEFWSNGKNWPLEPRFVELQGYGKPGGTRPGPYWGDWRFSVAPTSPSAEDRFLNVLTVGDATLSAPVAAQAISTEEGDGVRLSLPDGKKVELTFFRRGPVGGLVRVGDGPARPLATTVQKQSGICGL